jgi:hypothetical protein
MRDLTPSSQQQSQKLFYVELLSGLSVGLPCKVCRSDYSRGRMRAGVTPIDKGKPDRGAGLNGSNLHSLYGIKDWQTFQRIDCVLVFPLHRILSFRSRCIPRVWEIEKTIFRELKTIAWKKKKDERWFEHRQATHPTKNPPRQTLSPMSFRSTLSPLVSLEACICYILGAGLGAFLWICSGI